MKLSQPTTLFPALQPSTPLPRRLLSHGAILALLLAGLLLAWRLDFALLKHGSSPAAAPAPLRPDAARGDAVAGGEAFWTEMALVAGAAAAMMAALQCTGSLQIDWWDLLLGWWWLSLPAGAAAGLLLVMMQEQAVGLEESS